MVILVFTTKGGAGKSTIAREIVSAERAKDITIVEIDSLNMTQKRYEKSFKAVVELDNTNIESLYKILRKARLGDDNVVIDVGSDNLEMTSKILTDLDLFRMIDLIIIPIMPGETDVENAFKVTRTMQNKGSRLMFILNNADAAQTPKKQFASFYNNTGKFLDSFDEKAVIVIGANKLFHSAQKSRKTIYEICSDPIDYEAEANKLDPDSTEFDRLLDKELLKRTAKILYERTIKSAHDLIWSSVTAHKDHPKPSAKNGTAV